MIARQDQGARQEHQRRSVPVTTGKWGHRQPANVDGRAANQTWLVADGRASSLCNGGSPCRAHRDASLHFPSSSPFRHPVVVCCREQLIHQAQTLVGRRPTTFWRAEAQFHITLWQGCYRIGAKSSGARDWNLETGRLPPEHELHYLQAPFELSGSQLRGS